MEALNVVLDLLTKKLIGKIKFCKRRGPKGYGFLSIVRTLLYCTLRELFSSRKALFYFEKNPKIAKKLKLFPLPNRRTLDRWKKKYSVELEQIIALAGDLYLQLMKSEWTILDSTPLKDEQDKDSTIGYNSEGKFCGFKLHMSCDEREVPLRATVSQAHVHDSQKAERLLAPTPWTGGDSAYDAEWIKQKVLENGGTPCFVHNPRREGKERKMLTPLRLKKVRYMIEQCNGFVKSQVMKHDWHRIKGLGAKANFALTAVLAVQALALFNLKRFAYPSIRIAEVRV